MNEFWDRELGNNPLQAYLWVALAIALVLLLNRPLARLLSAVLYRLLRRRWPSIDKQKLADLITPPLGAFLAISLTMIAFSQLEFPQAINVRIYKFPLDRILLSLGILLQIATFTWLLLRLIDFMAAVLEQRAISTPDHNHNQLVVFFRDFLKVVIGIIGVMLILHFAFSYNIGTLLTGLSIVGAAVALALRESLENLIASFVIFFDKPFSTGDFVKVQNVAGTVERIGLRSTRVRTTDKSYITVPNKQMVDSILDNVSRRSQIRGELNLQLHQDTTPARLEQLLNEVRGFLAGKEEVVSQQVLLNDIRGQVFIIFIEYFTPPIDWHRFTDLRQELNLFILHTMERLEIRVAV